MEAKKGNCSAHDEPNRNSEMKDIINQMKNTTGIINTT